MRELSEKERLQALDNAYKIVLRNLPDYTYKCQNHSSENGIYKPIDNIEWTTGFWPGELWLLYEYTGDEKLAAAGDIFVESFRDRIKNQIAVEHHDMGFLYTPSALHPGN